MRRRVLPVVVCVAVFYAVFVSVRLEQHGVLWFVHLGKVFVTASEKSTVITPELGWQSKLGYDGQYYFSVAADPQNARYYMPGSAGIIYSRAFYPAISRAAGGGSVRAIPYAMLIVNLLAVAAGTLAIGLWLVRRGSSPWWAVLYGLYPGLVFGVFRDLTEPLSFGLVALALLAYDRTSPRRLVGAAALFALAVLTRETVIPFALAAAAALVVADSGRRRWLRGTLFALGSAGPLLVWRQIVRLYVHEPTQETGSSGWGIPFHGLFYWPFDQQHRVLVLTVVLPALLFALGALVLLWRRRGRLEAALVLVNVLAFVVFLPASVDIDYAAAARAAIGCVLAAIYCVPAWQQAGVPRWALLGGAAVSSLAWYLFVANHYGVGALRLITT